MLGGLEHARKRRKEGDSVQCKYLSRGSKGVRVVGGKCVLEVVVMRQL